jgi:hypothetical protein
MRKKNESVWTPRAGNLTIFYPDVSLFSKWLLRVLEDRSKFRNLGEGVNPNQSIFK